MIWLALVWPLIFCLVLLCVPQFRVKTVWFEYVLPWIPVVLFILLTQGCAETIQTRDTELLGGYATEAAYYEEWNERVPCSHPKYRTETYIDSDGDIQTRQVFDGWEHFYDVDHHPERWVLYTTLRDFSISKGQYRAFVNRWGNQQFVDLGRDYHTIDGDKYYVQWNGVKEDTEPVFIQESWVNKTQNKQSLFSFEEIDPTVSPVHDYPELDGWSSDNVLGFLSNPSANQQLAILNGTIGGKHECIVWICTWKNKPISVAFDQQHYWKGGNKNELVICISVDDSLKPQWANVFSWMDDQTFSYKIKNFILDQKQVDLSLLLLYLEHEIPSKWKRKEFSANAEDGGFDYISVDMPAWALWTAHILAFLSSLGVALFIYHNDLQENKTTNGTKDNFWRTNWRRLRGFTSRQVTRFRNRRLDA